MTERAVTKVLAPEAEPRSGQDLNTESSPKLQNHLLVQTIPATRSNLVTSELPQQWNDVAHIHTLLQPLPSGGDVLSGHFSQPVDIQGLPHASRDSFKSSAVPRASSLQPESSLTAPFFPRVLDSAILASYHCIPPPLGKYHPSIYKDKKNPEDNHNTGISLVLASVTYQTRQEADIEKKQREYWRDVTRAIAGYLDIPDQEVLTPRLLPLEISGSVTPMELELAAGSDGSKEDSPSQM
ncbi:hypothetical protein DL98DRAFT_522830 [Cadophora sp. DSE1049]|nr:hypothetical protein DL98DRAFT_522830 [Cadophora sp. DSE1049]